ncbi:transporter substrate-binding domain-containing protein [uncultured Neptuniibacter sp.]|uniref:substrate-binding periplasmic protein n=1 Tax=uncultured Neptuniibacter sp. TaxID=502143 RepID=UPI0032B2DF37
MTQKFRSTITTMILRFSILFILTINWPQFVSTSLADDAVNSQSEPIIIRTIGFPPYGIQGTPEPSGIYYDAANMLLEKTGYSSENYITPYTRTMKELKSGHADMTIMFKYDELEDHVIYIAPLPSLKTVVIGLENNNFESVHALKGKVLAYLRGAKFNELIDNDPEILKHTTLNFAQAVKMLKRGRVDAIIGPMDPIISASKMLPNEQITFGEPLILHENTPWVQISKKSQHKFSVEKLREAFKELMKEGMLTRLREKYL